MDTDELKTNVKKTDNWIRGLHMVILFVALRIAELILFAIIVFQFGMTVITGKRHLPLDQFSKNITLYIKNIFLFLAYHEDQKPFPFGDWEESIK